MQSPPPTTTERICRVAGWPRAGISCLPPIEAMSGRLFLVVLHFLEVGVDDVFAGGPVLLLGAATGARPGIATARLLRTIQGFPELHGGLRERRRLGLDGLGIVALHGFLQLADGRFDAGLVAGR